MMFHDRFPQQIHSITLCLLMFLVSFGVPMTATAQSTMADAIQNFVSQLEEANPDSRPMRLAVMTFVSTANMQTAEEFGSFYREALTTDLSQSSRKFRVFERSRIDAVLEEHALGMSGMLSAENAIKLGELVPIDAILTGSYTRFDKHVTINARLIDVVTGEILSSLKSDIKLTSDLDRLFAEQIDLATETDAEKRRSACEQKQATIKQLLNDLTSESKIERVATEAMSVPFDMDCGIIHFTVMSRFKRYDVKSTKYSAFLLRTLQRIEFPANDERALSILGFFGADGKIDKDEWRTGIGAVTKIGNYQLSSYLSRLLLPRELPDNLDTHAGRIDHFFDLVGDRKVGLPVAIDFNLAFFEMMDGLNSNYAEDTRLLYYCLSKYREKLSLDSKTASRLHGIMSSVYKREPSEERKINILKWLAELTNKRPIDEDMGDDLYALARSFEITSYKEKNPEELIKTPPAHLEILIKLSRDRFCEALKIAKYRSQIEDRQEFCVMNNISCKGHAPDIIECISILASESDARKRERTLELVILMGERAAPAEEAVLGILLDPDQQALEKEAVIILGNIRTSNTKALDMLIESLNSLGYQVAQEAENALTNIGAPAVQHLITAIDSRFGGVQYKAVTALGRIGKEAQAAVPRLRRLVEESNNAAVHTAAVKALRQIEK